MILERTAVTLAEVKEIVNDLEGKEDLNVYLKKFNKLTKDKALALSEEIQGLENMKIRGDDVIKLVDFLPKDVEDLNKIFREVSLTEEESNAIIDITKKY